MTRALTLFLMLLFATLQSFAAPGDTTVVQCFTFSDPSPQGWGAPYTGEFRFPEAGKSWSKILMVKTLKCDSSTAADKFPCGEWDYHTTTRLLLERDSSEEAMELAAYITPYGIRLDLTADGWEWVAEVTDYAPLLTGTRKLMAGNNQELLDLKFLFIEGTPPRQVLSVENLWETKLYPYSALADDSVLQARRLVLNPAAAGFKLRARISGHGHQGPVNCCEWDPKTHGYIVNGEEKYRWIVWTDCGFNAVFPQGGTWPFDRAGWCPGTFVNQTDVELTGRYFPGDTLTLDYDVEMYRSNGEAMGEFRMAHQLFTYGPVLHRYDAEVLEIIAPSTLDRHRRLNPALQQAVVVIRNNGDVPLQQLQIRWHAGRRHHGTFQWCGNLPFGASDTVCFKVSLPTQSKTPDRFSVSLAAPNSATDEVMHNNTLSSLIPLCDLMPRSFVLRFLTNDQGRSRDSQWRLLDAQGRVMAEGKSLSDSTVYAVPFHLTPGGYTLVITDSREDGISRHWWLRGSSPDKVGINGKISLESTEGTELTAFPPDFGEKIIYRFVIR